MDPMSGAVLERRNSNSRKELSWLDRLQLKLDTLCEIEGGGNPSEVNQDTGSFFENQLCTNVRKFCAEFVRELMLPEDRIDVAPSDDLQEDSALTTSGNNEVEKPLRVVASDLQGSRTDLSSHSISEKKAALMTRPKKIVAELQRAPAVESMHPKPPRVPEAPVFFIGDEQAEQELGTSKFADEEAEQYAHWFVSEEYRRMRLGKSNSTSSIQSWDSHQRAPSSDSLLEWELI